MLIIENRQEEKELEDIEMRKSIKDLIIFALNQLMPQSLCMKMELCQAIFQKRESARH